MSQLFNDINRGLCDNYHGLNPLELLDYPAEDVFNLINATIDFNQRNKGETPNNSGVIRRPAGDDWF